MVLPLQVLSAISLPATLSTCHMPESSGLQRPLLLSSSSWCDLTQRSSVRSRTPWRTQLADVPLDALREPPLPFPASLWHTQSEAMSDRERSLANIAVVSFVRKGVSLEGMKPWLPGMCHRHLCPQCPRSTSSSPFPCGSHLTSRCPLGCCCHLCTVEPPQAPFVAQDRPAAGTILCRQCASCEW